MAGYRNNTTEGNQQAKWLTERDVSAMTGISLSSLRKYRQQNRHIPYVKVGRSVRYRVSVVIAFMDAHRIDIRN